MIARMISAGVIAVALTVPAASVLAQAAPAKSSTVTAAMPAPDDRARQWLTLVDDGNYAQSWNEAGAAFQKRAAADVWAKQAIGMRQALGAVVSRDLKAIDISRRNTAVVRYDTSFAHKTGATETVTLAFEKGAWAVENYTLK